jgi:hypothetical protein
MNKEYLESKLILLRDSKIYYDPEDEFILELLNKLEKYNKECIDDFWDNFFLDLELQILKVIDDHMYLLNENVKIKQLDIGERSEYRFVGESIYMFCDAVKIQKKDFQELFNKFNEALERRPSIINNTIDSRYYDYPFYFFIKNFERDEIIQLIRCLKFLNKKGIIKNFTDFFFSESKNMILYLIIKNIYFYFTNRHQSLIIKKLENIIPNIFDRLIDKSCKIIAKNYDINNLLKILPTDLLYYINLQNS